jgi:hypothetical protein
MILVFTAIKKFSAFHSALWVLLYRQSLGMPATVFLYCPCLLFQYNSCCCIIQQWPCLHSLHLLGGSETDIPVSLARIWTQHSRIWSVSATYSVPIFGSALEELTVRNVWRRRKFACLLYVLSHLHLVPRLSTSGDMPSLLLFIFITCTWITLHFTFVLFTELNSTLF